MLDWVFTLPSVNSISSSISSEHLFASKMSSFLRTHHKSKVKSDGKSQSDSKSKIKSKRKVKGKKQTVDSIQAETSSLSERQ
jgi:hypothetical protein